MLMAYFVWSLRIVVITETTSVKEVEDRLHQLVKLEEEFFSQGFIKMLKRKDKRYGMTDTLRTSSFNLEVLFLCMIENFSSIEGS